VAGGTIWQPSGKEAPIEKTEILNTGTAQWSYGPDLPGSGPAKVVTLADGRVFGIVGGRMFISNLGVTAFSTVRPPVGTVPAMFNGAPSPWVTLGGLTQNPAAISLLSTGDMLAVGPPSTKGRWAALLRNGASSWSAVAPPSLNFADQLVGLGNGRAMLTGGVKPGCGVPVLCSATPLRRTQVFDIATDTWTSIADAPQDIAEWLSLPSGRALFAGVTSVGFSPPGLADTIAPHSTTNTAPHKDHNPTRIYGVSMDADSGVRSILVMFRPRAGFNAFAVQGWFSACDAGRHRCEWTAKVPLKPGVYMMSAAATDFAGNVEFRRGERSVTVA
jgi:hypothetical protein